MTPETLMGWMHVAFDGGVLLALVGLRRRIDYTSRTVDSIEMQVRNVEVVASQSALPKEAADLVREVFRTHTAQGPGGFTNVSFTLKPNKQPMARKRPARRKP